MALKAFELTKLGGGRQFVLRTADDLQFIEQIDEAFWGVVRVQISSLNCDRKFLQLIDTDKDDVILPNEVIKSWYWLRDILLDHAILADPSDVLPLGAINASIPEGMKILEAANTIASNQNRSVNLEQVRSKLTGLVSGPLKGDGIICEAAVTDPDAAELLRDIISCGGSTNNASGQPGITAAALDAFLASARSYLEWLDGNSDSDNLPFGEETASNHAAMSALKDKIDDYFTTCELISLDRVNAIRFETTPENLPELDITSRQAIADYIASAPLSTPDPSSKLQLMTDRINPAWRDAATKFAEIFKTKILTPDKWNEIKQSFAPYESYLANKTGSEVEQLGADKLRGYLDGTQADTLREVMEHDATLGSEIEKHELLEKLVLFRLWFFRFMNNYVSLAELFAPETPSMIQAGSLVLDGYRFDMCIRVDNPAQHKKMAENANIRVIYLKADKPGEAQPVNLAVAVTTGCGIKRHFIGKYALFIDSEKKQWQAQITDMLDAPVTIREIMFQPLGKIRDLIKSKFEKFSAASMKNVDTQIAKEAAAPVPTQPVGSSGGALLLSGGLGIAAVGGSLAYLIKTLNEPKIWTGLTMVILLFLVITAIPIIIAGIIKFRQRSLARFLEAAGWAINPVIRLTRRTGRLFTHKPQIPDKKLSDEEKKQAKSTHDTKLLEIILLTAIALITLVVVLLIFASDKF